jgi:hypothetical protein
MHKEKGLNNTGRTYHCLEGNKPAVKMSTILGENKRSLEVYTGLEFCVPGKVPDVGYWFGYCRNS